ncbi:Protein of unknown function (DUF2637) (plasmid) [Mycolicibacterium chubuense NBB4]|uniref:DUF2637 domain-containing protein n=1 Tax=Mycolicibacterium chubuense (strain NBB4) TaxID=710421 RepID=I4BTP8_MYCCN|nr:DUF2637 domain-containing protein [Mycolicibacterium chubuense]AFM20655.1 Protein of unknown function (DUF2637) [Mycolicibacterium chubuense NBB4]
MTAVMDTPASLDSTPAQGGLQEVGSETASGAADERRGLSPADRREQQSARLSLVRLTRSTAVAITVVIGASSFVLSFSSLRDLAARTAWPGYLAWLWPVIVDGAIILATMALVAFSAYPEQRSARRYFWTLLTVGACVSVSGNAVHAMIPNPAVPTPPLGPWFAAAIACVPPVALVGATHALSILWRFTPYEKPDEQAQLQNSALALAAERLDRWDAVAAAIHERGSMMSYPTQTIAAVLRHLHDHQPPLPLRQIGEQVGIRHDAVARIRDAAKAVLPR